MAIKMVIHNSHEWNSGAGALVPTALWSGYVTVSESGSNAR